MEVYLSAMFLPYKWFYRPIFSKFPNCLCGIVLHCSFWFHFAMHAGLLKTLKKVRENLLYSVVLTPFENCHFSYSGLFFLSFFWIKKNRCCLIKDVWINVLFKVILWKKIITATKRFYNQSVNSPTPNPIRNDWDKKNWSDMHLHVCRALVV